MKTSKKCDFPEVRAKLSQIGRDKLINGKEDFIDVRHAKQVFYPRNLNTGDIEGTDVGSLNTKFMKNWHLAQELKSHPNMRPHRVEALVQAPYGDGLNNEQYLPENLKHAREMAARNRNRLRTIQNVERYVELSPAVKPILNSSEETDQNIRHQIYPTQFEGRAPTSQNYENQQSPAYDKTGQIGIMNQYEDSRALYENNRSKSIDTDTVLQNRTDDNTRVNENTRGPARLNEEQPVTDHTLLQAMDQMDRDRVRFEHIQKARDQRFNEQGYLDREGVTNSHLMSQSAQNKLSSMNPSYPRDGQSQDYKSEAADQYNQRNYSNTDKDNQLRDVLEDTGNYIDSQDQGNSQNYQGGIMNKGINQIPKYDQQSLERTGGGQSFLPAISQKKLSRPDQIKDLNDPPEQMFRNTSELQAYQR